MKLPELLAPAGSFDAAVAAFTYGADAIYLGLSRFSARADATNFSDEELIQIVAYARNLERPRKVYVTLNTLIETSEMDALIPSLELLEQVKIDGVIVQDLGLAARIHRDFPTIPLHASTQLACSSLSGARALKALGFVRIVTARELSLAEAAEIGEKADIEIEVFVHGALCYSISGLCLFSSLTTERSGNRGKCAYCCRQAFSEVNANGEVTSAHPFSMRDLALIDCGEALRTLPLASLKIEGRMKNALYVAAVTDLYRTLLDGKLTADLRKTKTENLRTIFSRPWTTLYATDTSTPPSAIIDPLCVGHRGAPIGRVLRIMRGTDGIYWMTFDTERALEKHDGLQIDPPNGGRPIGFAVLKLRDSRTHKTAIALPAKSRVDVALPPNIGTNIPRGATIYCSASQAVRRAFPVTKPRLTELRTLQPADLTLDLSPTTITLSGNGVTVSTPATLTAAKDASKTAEAAQKHLARLGDDGYYLRHLTLHDHGLFLPAGLLNATRRAWAEQARIQESATQTVSKRSTSSQYHPITLPAVKEVRYTLKVSALQTPTVLGDQLPHQLVVSLTDHTTFDALRPWLDAVPREQLRFALPVALRKKQIDTLCQTIGQLLDRGFRKFECADLVSWQLLQDWSPACDALDITADWTWYAINADAEQRQIACGITGNVTGPEANLPNLKDTAGALPKEILIAQYAPLFIAYTPPHTTAQRLLTRDGKQLLITQIGSLWVTFDVRPWSAQRYQADLMRAGFGNFRIDLSWAGAHLPVKTWQEMLSVTPKLDAHFATHRL